MRCCKLVAALLLFLPLESSANLIRPSSDDDLTLPPQPGVAAAVQPNGATRIAHRGGQLNGTSIMRRVQQLAHVATIGTGSALASAHRSSLDVIDRNGSQSGLTIKPDELRRTDKVRNVELKSGQHWPNVALLLQNRIRKTKRASSNQKLADAALYGFLSATSLPLGGIFGIWFHPANKYVVARLMSFGAGALLFGVTVELYGEILGEIEVEEKESSDLPDNITEVEKHHETQTKLRNLYGRIGISMCCCLLGAYYYMVFNKWLNSWARNVIGAADETSDDTVLLPPNSAPAIKVTVWQQTVSTSSTGITGGPAEAEAEAGGEVQGRKEEVGALGDDQEVGEKMDVVRKWATAYAILAGTYVDGISEGILIGVMAGHGTLSIDFVVSVFLANMPEAFSTSSMLKDLKQPTWKILGAWIFLNILTGVMSLLSCVAVSSVDLHGAGAQLGTGIVEGLAAGAMMMMIISIMIPEVIEVEGDVSAMIMILGFLVSICIGVGGGYVDAIGHPRCSVERNITSQAEVVFCEQ